MCYNCYNHVYGSPVVESDEALRCAGLIAELYDTADGGVGGYAHIVVDDWNLEDHCLDSCIESCDKERNMYCEETREASLKVLESMKRMPIGERATALALHDGFIDSKKQ